MPGPGTENEVRQSTAGETRLRIGPAGWSYPDWHGFVYPSRKPKGFQELSLLASIFDTIEINTSFYRPLNPQHVRMWLERVSFNPNFKFTAKLWRAYTHEGSITAEEEKQVRQGFDLLRQDNKLGAILVQFPFSFHRTTESVNTLANLLEKFRAYPLVVELRHETWNVAETYALLRKAGAGFCNIDQPIIGQSLRPSGVATSDVGYVRLHGRRYDTWFSDDPALTAHERYNYLYGMEELREWVPRTRKVMEGSKDVFVVTNNHYQGKSVVTALQLIHLLKGQAVKVPGTLLREYPKLKEIALEEPPQGSLFS